MKRNRQVVVAVLLALGVLGGLWVAKGRIAVERGNQTVAVCLDVLEVRQLAALTGSDATGLLQQFKAAGATHLAVSERTLDDRVKAGEVRFGPAGDLLDARGAPVQASIPTVLPSMTKLGLGYEPAAVAAAKQSGLGLVARPVPDFLVTPEAVDSSLAAAAATGAKIVLFNGVSVAGGALLAKPTAELLAKHGLQFGYVELVPMDGNAQLASACKFQIIRTHSISQDEMVKTAPGRALDRFGLAVTERNVRLCYARLHLTPRPEIIKANLAYVRQLAEDIKRNGYQLGDPRPFAPLSLPPPALMLLALGVLGGLLWLVDLVLRPGDKWFWGLLGLGVLVALGGPVAANGLLRVLVSLLAGIVFPTLALLHVANVAAAAGEGKSGDVCQLVRLSPRFPCLGALGLTIRAAALTSAGGLMLAAALSSSDYMMQVSQFRGVKLAQVLPLLIVLAVMLARSTAAWKQAGAGWPALRAGLSAAGEAVIKYWHAVAIMFGLAVLGFMLLRSGNESAVEVPGWERSVRALLDQLLIARPRTKEILVGYPALFLGLLLLLKGRPRTTWVLLTAGAIGLISTLNTFCHIHTPLLISVLRVFNGVWLGIVIGGLYGVARLIGERLLRLVWWPNSQ